MLGKQTLKDKILSELAAQGFDISASGRDGADWLVKFVQAISNAIVDEIQQNGVD